MLADKVKRPIVPAALLLGLALIWFAIRSVHGIHFLTFSDESGHLIGARAIYAGDRLYRDFIDEHGPVVFMLAHAFGVVFGWREPLNTRWAMVGVALLASLGVASSPVLKTRPARLWATTLFVGLLAAPWLVQALNMVNYYLIGGAFVAVALSGLVLPAWVGHPVGRAQAFISGVCLSLLCADAYSMAPTAFLLAASAGISLFSAKNMPAALAYAAAGFAAGGICVLVWLLIYGDVLGYLAFHIIMNQADYARYVSSGWHVTLASMIPSLSPDRLMQSLASIICFSAFALLLTRRTPSWKGKPVTRLVSWALILTAILMLNFRGANGFQDGSFAVASFACLALIATASLPAAWSATPWKTWLVTACLGAFLVADEATCRAAVNSPWSVARAAYTNWPPSTLAVDHASPLYSRIREVLRPDERLLVLVFSVDKFLFSGYLPMRKYHGYLPWEADYAREPWFGRQRDLCVDLAQTPPPVIVYDGWIVWGRWNPKDFIPCLAPLLAKDYVADAIPTLYIRRDRAMPK